MKGPTQFAGTWVSFEPYDSDDYLIEWVISIDDGVISVTARDLQDNEEMEISEVWFDGTVLLFTSLMPSTGRRGLNRFRLKDNDRIESEFTFTVLEELKRTSP